jgi:hypothetical protein
MKRYKRNSLSEAVMFAHGQARKTGKPYYVYATGIGYTCQMEPLPFQVNIEVASNGTVTRLDNSIGIADIPVVETT